MSKDKKSKSLSSDTARKIWLAGIGAYGRAFSEAQEQLSKVTKGGGKVFDDLVQKGEVLETVVTYKGKDVIEKAKDGFDIDDRIASMRSRLKRSGGDSADIEARLDGIEAKLDQILSLLAPKKPAAKKRKPRKVATIKTPARKTAPKKAAVKKTVAKKTVRKAPSKTVKK